LYKKKFLHNEVVFEAFLKSFAAHISALKKVQKFDQMCLAVSRKMKKLKNKYFEAVFSIDKAEK